MRTGPLVLELATVPRTVVACLHRHPGAAIVVTVGILLRVLMMIAYPPALWFETDSKHYIVASQTWPSMPPRWPYGWVLKAFEWTGTFYSVVAIQHLAGVLLAIASYLLLLRMGTGRWLATLAIAPLLLDATQLTLEQYLLTETLFTTALAAAALLLVWRERPGVLTCATAGVVVTIGWATRPTGVIAVVALLLFLLLPWRGWRPPVAYLLGVVSLLGVITAGAGSLKSGLGMEGGMFLYGRTAHFADCDRLELRAELRPLCPTQPVDQRPERPDWFLWNKDSPIVNARSIDDLNEFAVEVIKQQPGDYLVEIATDSAPFFVPVRLGPMESCLAGWWRPQHYPMDWRSNFDCVPRTARGDYQPDARPSVDAEPTTISRFMHVYGRYAVMPPWAMSFAVLLALVGALWVRRAGLRLARTALLYVGIGVGIMLFSVATTMFDYRYGLPALAFTPIAAAIGWQRLRSLRSAPATARETGQLTTTAKVSSREP